MPKMDGIKATEIIRSMGYKHAIIALTANALIGQSEMFLKNGFDGFISKPIDSSELNHLLNSFIRNKKPSQDVEAVRNEEHEYKTIIGHSGLEKIFAKDVESAVNVLESLYSKMPSLNDEETGLYIVTVHGMKSALANFGEKGLSSIAFKLEQAGEKRNFDIMLNETPAFLNALQSLNSKLKSTNGSGDVKISDENFIFLHEKLLAIKTACMIFDITAIRAILNDFGQKTWPTYINTVLDEIALYILHSDFEEAAKAADRCISLSP